MKETRTLMYFGEEYQVDVTIYTDPITGERYTTTESDQEWWKDLRTQYITRHPEVLEKFSSKPTLTKDGDMWRAKYCGTEGFGNTKEEAIKNLYICL